MIRFGVHCSIRKGLEGALDEARALGCEAMQVFARSPRMWRMRVPGDGEAAAFASKRRACGIRPLVIHTPYLPNLATSREDLYRRSVESLRDDLTVADLIGAEYLVIHPGAYSETAAPEEGLRRVVAAVRSALGDAPGDTVVLIENVAGGGRRVGGPFAELAAILDGADLPDRTGVCLDTAHALGAGYDLSSSRGVDAALAEFDALVGLSRLKVVHFNDSLAPCGSRRDRHQHLGQGYVGLEGFRHLVRRLRDVADAGILETPKDPPGSDAVNLKTLYSLRD